MKVISDLIMAQADKMLAASKSLDYQRILQHDRDEVLKLKGVLDDLNLGAAASDESLEDYASKQPETPSASGLDIGLDDLMMADLPAEDDADALAAVRKESIEAELVGEGFSDRLDKVYNSFASSRASLFSQVPHARGLPEFDVVMAPDFAPVAGLHGVFISADKIMSVILPSDQPNADWSILKERAYSNQEELIEFLTLIAAGFDVP